MNRNLLQTTALGLAAALSGCVFDSTVASDPAPIPSAPATPGAAKATRLFVMGQDFTAKKAVLDAVGADGSFAADLKDWTTSDVILAAEGDSLYVLNRKLGTVTGFTHGDLSRNFLDVRLTAATDDPTSGANPYAVAKVGGRLWVACYGSAFLKAVDLSNQKLVDSIDLSGFAHPGTTNPNQIDVHVWNGKLVVTLGRLDGWKPGDSSLVVVLDPTTKGVAKRIALPWKNPYSVSWKGDTLLVACVGKWTTDDYSGLELDGGLALVDLASGIAKPVVSELAAGENITIVKAVGGGRAYVAFSDASYASTIASVSLADGKIGAKVPGIRSAAGFAWTGSDLWVANQDKTAPAVVHLDSTGAVVGKKSTTLPPGSIVLLP